MMVLPGEGQEKTVPLWAGWGWDVSVVNLRHFCGIFTWGDESGRFSGEG